MAIPPFEKTGQNFNAMPIEYNPSQAQESPLHFPQPVENQIQVNQRVRQEKINQLSRFKETANSFIKEHQALEVLIETRRRSSTSQMNSNQATANKAIEAQIFHLTDRYKEHGFNPMFIETAVLNEENDELDIKYYTEKSKTVFINKLAYIEEVDLFINENKQIILNEFAPPEQRNANPELINFQIELTSEETHHQGKHPAFITFEFEKNPIFKIVYKPRNAAIDLAVINTFDQINQLSSNERSSPIPLPTYKIVNFNDRSIWEYVEGKDVGKFGKVDSAGLFIRQKLKNKSEKIKAQQRLNRMDAILTAMGISDLHKDNVRIRTLQQGDIEFVPIDLENREIGASTQLGGRPEAHTLTPAEINLIRRYFEPIAAEAPVRYLPLSTNVLTGLIGDFKSVELLSTMLFKQFEKHEFALDLNLTELQNLLLISILNHDVPYFTEWRGRLYYGLPNAHHQIAHKGS